MNKGDVVQLLTVASGFDRFIRADEVTSRAWLLALGHLDYADAEAAIVAHYVGPNAKEILGVRHILAAVADKTRDTAAAIAADVRSAKARGLIDKSWPERDRLPGAAAVALFEAREHDRAKAIEESSELLSYHTDPLKLAGNIGRRVE